MFLCWNTLVQKDSPWQKESKSQTWLQTEQKKAKVEGLNSLISEIKASNVIHIFPAVEAKLPSIENRSKHKIPEGKTLDMHFL